MHVQQVKDQRVNGDLLAADTTMSAVTLYVADLAKMTAYYRDALALTVLDERAAGIGGTGIVTLGRNGTPLVVLRHAPDLPVPARGQAGLFHTAIHFEDDASLARALATVAAVAPRTFTGSADHLVSKAFYFTDPEGNGVELYADRPRSEWTWRNGSVQMASNALDPNAFVAENLGGAGDEREPAVIGHVHLQVGDIPTARRFYVDTLGFEATLEGRGALFVSAGGYHHHMAMNTWNSAGAGPRASSLGLGEVAIVVPTVDDLASLGSRLKHHRLPVRDDGASLSFEDPWSNLVRVSVPD